MPPLITHVYLLLILLCTVCLGQNNSILGKLEPPDGKVFLAIWLDMDPLTDHGKVFVKRFMRHFVQQIVRYKYYR